MLLDNLKTRARAMRAMRHCFDGAGFCEVETSAALREIAPEEIAIAGINMIRSSFITGEVLNINGGAFMRP